MARRFATRRRLIALLGVCAVPRAFAQLTASSAPFVQLTASPTPFARVTPGHQLAFPRDYGSHPSFRIEWWYVTGVLHSQAGPLGFQITFFRARPAHETSNPSRFAPRQLLIAHAALSDPAEGHLLHQQRAAREGFGLAEAAAERTGVGIDRWRLEQDGNGYRMQLPLDAFGFDFELAATQPPLLNGDAGYSRKGPRPESASYYYSIPQLALRGTLQRPGRSEQVTGTAWLDHEWSSSYLDERAAGWDWIGINLDDGGALMAFRMRTREGGTLWTGATVRTADGTRRTYANEQVAFAPTRSWQSVRTGTRYPVAWQVRIGTRTYALEPLMDDQELDARATTGTVYWEGAMRLLEDGRKIGGGYLELTGYWRKLEL